MADNLLDIWQVNVRSLSDNKINAIKAELLLDFDIICLTETFMPNSNVTDLTLNGFHPILHKDRANQIVGGVALYAAEHLSAERIYNAEIPQLEAMWVKIKAGNNIIFICVCYRPPNIGNDFWVSLQDSIDLIKQNGLCNIILKVYKLF